MNREGDLPEQRKQRKPGKQGFRAQAKYPVLGQGRGGPSQGHTLPASPLPAQTHAEQPGKGPPGTVSFLGSFKTEPPAGKLT